jgi:thioesterase domain-containing protein/acyl carrier protein
MNAPLHISDDLLELEISELWKRLLKRDDDIGLDEDFFEAGGDSLSAMQLMAELETLCGRPYPDSELAGITIRRIARVLRERIPAGNGCIVQAKAGIEAEQFHHDLEAKDLWTRLRAVRRMARLIDAHSAVPAPTAAGGIPFFFCHGDFQARGLYAHRLAALLPADQPVFLLHPEKEPPAGTTVEELATQYLQAVRRMAPGMPVILGGYCNGGYVAWHLAHLLRQKGVEVLGLFLVETPSFNARALTRAVARLMRPLPRLQELATRGVRSLYRHGVRDFSARALQALRRLPRKMAPAATPATWWKFVRGMSARYVPPAIDVAVYCFIAEDGTRVENDPQRWRRFAPRVTEVLVPGTHLSAIIAYRHALAEAFARAICEMTARRGLSPRGVAPERSRYRAAPAGQPG